MTPDPRPEERDEIAGLEAECERPDRLRALLGELIRARSVIGTCRANRERLPRPVQRALDRVPPLNAQQQWARAVAANDAEPDPRLPGAPRLI